MHTRLILAVSLLFASSRGQSLDDIMNKKAINCWDVGHNAGELIPRMHREGIADSLAVVVTYWEDKCGISEPLLRYNLLKAVGADKSPFAEGDSLLVGQMIYYRNRIESLRDRGEDAARVNEWYSYSLPKEFDNFTVELAEKIWEKGGALDRTDTLLLLFYQNKFERFFKEIHHGRPDKLGALFQDQVDRALSRKKLSIGWIVGGWIPLGSNSLLGNHPIFGFYLGGEGRRFGLDIDMHFKFLPSENEYFVERNDSLVGSRHFFGGYIGLDATWRISGKGKALHPYGIFGIAFDGFDTMAGDKKEVENGSIGSLNLNLGLANRFYYSRSSYLALEARYNFVRYRNRGGTDLDGNTLSLLLKWGISANGPADSQLRNLGYLE